MGFVLIVVGFTAAVIVGSPANPQAENEVHWLFGVAGCWMVLFLPAFLIVHLRAVRPAGNAGNTVSIAGVHREFLESLNEQSETRGIEPEDELESATPWRGRVRRRGREGVDRASSSLECPSCRSPQVERLPPSQISPRPGYRCGGCGALLRERGTLPIYLLVLAIGCGFVGLFVYLLATGHAGPERFVTPLIGGICAIYSIRQLMRPVPQRRARDTEE
jgi:hypothetical protein